MSSASPQPKDSEELIVTNDTPKITTPATKMPNSPSLEQPTSPPVRSPIKTPGMTTPLPPIQSGSLRISKRRRLEPSSPAPLHSDTGSSDFKPMVTPSKLRSFSSPMHPISKRTPSLQDRPIPVLSPPSPPGSVASSSGLSTPNESGTLAEIPSSVSTSSDSSPVSAGTSKMANPVMKTRANGYRRVTSPLASKIRDSRSQELSKTEIELDREVLKWRRLLDVAKQAKKYEGNDNDEELKQLTTSWRNAAQQAASELFAQASERVEQMGGMEEFVRRQKENKNGGGFQKNSFDEYEIDYNSLTTEEKERFDALKEEYEDEVKKSKKEDEEEDDVSTEFTLKYMLKSLNVDYNLIYPDGSDEE